MAWICSTFDNIKEDDLKSNEIVRDSCLMKPSKKLCTNLWVDEHPPHSIEELSVQKKKVQEVQTWLSEAATKVKGRKVLLITGPPGTGKSAVIKVLSKEMCFVVREWTNPSIQKYDFLHGFGLFHENQFNQKGNEADKFAEFLFRSSKYNDICSGGKTSSNLVVVEEVPNVFIMNPFMFHELIKKYCSRCTTPVVFIFSDTNKENIGKTLFPADIQEELSVQNIVFNPVSAGLLLNGLNRVLSLTKTTNCPFFDSISASKKQFLQVIADRSGGDIRSAINSLQFTLMKGASAGAPQKKPAKECQRAQSDFVGTKDTGLILFRALGKVLYCKRNKSEEENGPSLAPHLASHRRRPLLEDPEEVFDRSATAASTFNLFLHHNCISFFSTVEAFSASMKYLCDADIFSSFWDPSNRLDLYTSSVSMRGMMHSLNEGKPGGQGCFKSLTRPSWFGYIQTSRDRALRARRICEKTFLSKEELFSVHIPLVAKIHLSSSTAVDGFIREVGLVYPRPQITSSDDLQSPSQPNPNDEQVAQDDEEFIIEEFDD